jgi:hypothetical protein
MGVVTVVRVRVDSGVWFFFFLVGLGGCQGRGSSWAIPEARAEGTLRSDDGGKGVAVLELFTSEGCSSCPPADALLAELSRDPRVFALSFHVDYWDQLGWPDRFSSPENTARQRSYATSFGSRSMYTPELVVGGVEGFVGSDGGKARSAIVSALNHPAPLSLTLMVRTVEGSTLEVDCKAPGAPPDALVNVALVDREATTQVRAGENAGRTLQHVNVVRAFVSSPAATSGAVRVTLPAGGTREGEEVIAFVQAGAGGGMPILGAARGTIHRE